MRIILGLFLSITILGCSMRTANPPPLRQIENNIVREERTLTLQELVNKMNFSEKNNAKYATISLKYAITNGKKAYEEKFIEVKNKHTNVLVSEFLDTLNRQVISELEAKNKIEARLAINRALDLVD